MAPEHGPATVTRADVLVAGSGAAGLTAALAAAAGGARVILAERSHELGGTTALSFGRVWVPANHHAPSDTREAARAYLTGLFSERYPEMADAFLAGAPEMARFVEGHSPLPPKRSRGGTGTARRVLTGSSAAARTPMSGSRAIPVPRTRTWRGRDPGSRDDHGLPRRPARGQLQSRGRVTPTGSRRGHPRPPGR